MLQHISSISGNWVNRDFLSVSSRAEGSVCCELSRNQPCSAII